MLIEEARWLKEALDEIGPEQGTTVLDIGSSTEYFRRVDQPYIDYFIFRPLRQRGARILHIDSRSAEGVDIVCDISAPESERTINEIPPGDIVICSNMLEHVRDREMVTRRLATLTRPGGFLVVTVPHVYRYHEDPIDTMYRPTNKDIEGLFAGSGFRAVRSTILDVDCGYSTRPSGLLPYIAFRTVRSFRFRVLHQAPQEERCKVSAVVMKKSVG